MKRVLSLAMSFLLVACLAVPELALTGSRASAFAAGSKANKADQAYKAGGTGQTDTLDEIARQIGDAYADPFAGTTKKGKDKALKLAADYPAAVDLRDVDEEDGTSYVTPVKFQNPWGDCWGFAAIAAAETSILGNDELRGDYVADIRKTDDAGKIQMDLSEKHLSYFAGVPINDPDNPQNGEGDPPFISEGDDPVAAIYNMGGHAPTATNLFASGTGPVLESKDPLYEYKGIEGTTQWQWVGDNMDKYEYSETDDWKLDESMRFDRSYSLSESYALPTPAGKIDGDDEDFYVFNQDGVDAIKEQLLNKRAVEIGYWDDTFNEALGETHSDYINNNWAQYTFYPRGPRHAVCIVGYDDRYPAENFRHELDEGWAEDGYTEEDTVPKDKDGNPADGAFLVKNSWGSGEEEFPDAGEGSWGLLQGQDRYPFKAVDGAKHTGYFWLSYYDQSIGTPEALAFDRLSDKDEIIDQHDYLPAGEYHAARVGNELRFANIFEAGKCQDVKQVSCETTYMNTEVTFQVYLLASENIKDPEDGILVDTIQAGPYKYGGIHKVDLSKPLRVMRGQSYAVVVTQRVPEDDGSKSYAMSVKMDLSGETVMNEGESFLYVDGKWHDYSDSDLREKILADAEWARPDYNYDNFPIKAYAEEKPDIVLEVDSSGFMMPTDPETGETPVSNVLAWITDNTDNSVIDLKTVVPEWKIAEGGEDVITLTDGRDPSRKNLTFKRYGGTYLIVTAEGIGTVVYPAVANLSSPWIKEIKTGKDSITITTYDTLEGGIAAYELSYSPKGKNDWKTVTYTELSNTFRVAGLSTGKYDIKLSRYSEAGGRKYYSGTTERTTDAVGLKNTLKASGKTVSVKSADLKKKAQAIKRSKAITVSKAKGRVTYAKKSGNKKITINKKNGNITIKKGLKKGKYPVKVKVQAAGKGYYLPAVKTVKVTVKVK